MADATPLHGSGYEKRVDVLVERVTAAIDLTVSEGGMPYVSIIGALELIKSDLLREIEALQ